jgi:hypothetical protein
MAAYKPGYGKVGRDYAMRMFTMAPEDDGPVWMVNLMKYKEVAAYTDGNPNGISGKEADDRYAPTKILREIGAEVPFFGDVVDQLSGDDVKWDRVGVVKYPTRKAFLDMQNREDFKGKHEHKEAGMEFTFVIGCQPSISTAPQNTNTNLADGPVVVVDVFRYAEQTNDQPIADTNAAAWFHVEGTIMGDGREWDEVRFSTFPSMQDYTARVSDTSVPTRDGHAISDAYTLVVRPSIDTFTTHGAV